jgi:hypothetical protein
MDTVYQSGSDLSTKIGRQAIDFSANFGSKTEISDSLDFGLQNAPKIALQISPTIDFREGGSLHPR